MARSDKSSSSLIFLISPTILTGSVKSSHSSSNTLITWQITSTGRILLSRLVSAEEAEAAPPGITPAISTNSTLAYEVFLGLYTSDNLSMRSSGTLMVAIFGAEFLPPATLAELLVSALNSEVLPTPLKPIIPIFIGWYLFNYEILFIIHQFNLILKKYLSFCFF